MNGSVFVYRNVRRKQYSIRATSGPDKGRVIGHADFVELLDAEFKVSEAGRQRVLRENCKNVHAGVVGTLVGTDHDPEALPTRVTYDPRRYATFVRRDDLAPVRASTRVVLRPDGVTVEGA